MEKREKTWEKGQNKKRKLSGFIKDIFANTEEKLKGQNSVFFDLILI